MKTVIMAGGKGTRISSVTKEVPKPMIRIGEMPILEHQISCLKSQGYDDIIITVSYMSDVIMNYFGDGSLISPVTKQPFGVHIDYFVEKESLGNAGALFQIKSKLQEDFLLINGDLVFDIDINRLVDYHKRCGGLATIFTHPNNHPYDSGLIVTDGGGRVVHWMNREDVRPAYYHNRVNAGIHVLSPKVLEQDIDTLKIDLDRQVLKPLVKGGEMFAYDSPEYVKDMGTPERYISVSNDYESGIICKKNLRLKQKAVFLDRDGTINKYVGFLYDIDDFELIDGVCEAINMINASEYLVFVVTNQPVIARGEMTFDELELIHKKMETLLGHEGAYIDGLYFCPHHPDKGYMGEIPELKMNCDCRKPQPGMLLRAAQEYNINLSESYFIGDSKIDVLAGMRAGCKTVLIGDGNDDFGQDMNAVSLLCAVKKIISI